MEPTVKASARHTIHVTTDTWRIRLSASAHSHPNDAYARRATAISAIGSVLIDVPLPLANASARGFHLLC